MNAEEVGGARPGSPGPQTQATDPTAVRREPGPRGRRLLVVWFLGGLVALGAAWWILSGSDDRTPGPGPIVDRLAATDWRLPPDPETGYRRLASIFHPDVRIDQATLGPEGTLAVALRTARDEPWVLRWNGGAWTPHRLPGRSAVTALAVDPEGIVYVGFRSGGFSRIAPTGATAEEEPPAGGNSVVGFAFDRSSRRGALMLSGGEVHTALRPLRTGSLQPVRMPQGARMRQLAYTEDGDLAVGGNTGAFFVATDDGWEEGTLSTGGQVAAIALAADGDLLTAQANGHVFRGSGTHWDPIGQVPVAPVALGSLAEQAVVVVGADGRVFAESAEGFQPLEGYQSPASSRVHAATVVGTNLVVASTEGLRVWDGETWSSTDPAVATPEGVVGAGGCEPVGPDASGPGVAGPLLDCGEGRFAVLGADGLEDVETFRLGGAEVSALDAARVIGQAEQRGAVWLGDTPWAPVEAAEVPGLERWDGSARRWVRAAELPPEEGRLLSIGSTSGPAASDAHVLWTLSQEDVVRVARATPNGTDVAFEMVADHPAFQAHHGPDWYPHAAAIHALGDQAALVVHDDRHVARVSRATDGAAVEPLALEPLGARVSVVAEGGRLLVLTGERVYRVGASGPAEPIEAPDGVAQGIERPFSRAYAGDLAYLGSARGRTQLVRCGEQRCATPTLPPWVEPWGVLRAGQGLGLVERGGMIGLLDVSEDR